MTQFALLFHDLQPSQQRQTGRQPHWDLLLQHGEELLTWALAENPLVGSCRLEARQLPPHRLDYLHLEGPLSGNRGTVTRWDRGDLYWQSAPAEEWWAILEGKRTAGELRLRPRPDGPWELEFRRQATRAQDADRPRRGPAR